jgi:hypothetical protein
MHAVVDENVGYTHGYSVHGGCLMTWTKLDDGFWMHPKVLMAGNSAAGIFARLLSYCGAYLTDGMIPSQIVATIVGQDRDALDELHRVGLIDLLETGGAVIPDYLDHQRSRAQVEADRETKRANGAKGGRPPKVTT